MERMLTPKIEVIKYDRTKQPYNQNKVIVSMLRAKIPKEAIPKILSRVEMRLYNGISTRELYQVLAQEISRQTSTVEADHFRLRENLARMDPFVFEKFVEKILSSEEYTCEWNVVVPGFWVEHQVDIIGKNRNGQYVMIEIKHHSNPHRLTGLGEVAELWARLEDFQHGYTESKTPYKFEHAWLITNTKFSEHAKKYAMGKELWLTGWRYHLNGKGVEDKNGMESRIERLGWTEVDRMINSVVGYKPSINISQLFSKFKLNKGGRNV